MKALRWLSNRRKIKGFMAQTYAAKYLLKAAASAPRDLVNAYVATYKPSTRPS